MQLVYWGFPLLVQFCQLHSMPKMFSPSTMFLKFFFAHENMKKTASKVAEPAQIQPKSQFLFHKNLPPRDFSIMTLVVDMFGNGYV